MNWISRTLVPTLILLLCQTPIPWGHSHIGMDEGQLAVHLGKYHASTRETELPDGWHWHFATVELGTLAEPGRDADATWQESIGRLLLLRIPSSADTSFNEQAHSCYPAGSGIVGAHAEHQQLTYLRLNVLLT